MARGYLAALDYCRSIHFDCPEYAPVFGLIASRLQASGDMHAFRTFVNSHADELRAEQECDRVWKSLRKYMEGPDAETVIARNRAAYEADQLEQAVNARGEQIALERELHARAKCFTDARKELTRDR